MITRQTYELSFLALPELSENDVQSMQSELAETITKAGGEVASTSDVHFVDLEYTMTKKVKSSNERYDQAYFQWIHFTIDPSELSNIENAVDGHASVLRYLLIKTVNDTEATNRFSQHEEEETVTVNDDQKQNEAIADKGSEDVAKVASDDLTKIEGIGPKIAEALTNEGFGTYEDLADSEIDELRSVLTANGFGNHEPGTWSQQAKLAHEGKWDELKEWQDQLNGGK